MKLFLNIKHCVLLMQRPFVWPWIVSLIGFWQRGTVHFVVKLMYTYLQNKRNHTLSCQLTFI